MVLFLEEIFYRSIQKIPYMRDLFMVFLAAAGSFTNA